MTKRQTWSRGRKEASHGARVAEQTQSGEKPPSSVCSASSLIPLFLLPSHPWPAQLSFPVPLPLPTSLCLSLRPCQGTLNKHSLSHSPLSLSLSFSHTRTHTHQLLSDWRPYAVCAQGCSIMCVWACACVCILWRTYSGSGSQPSQWVTTERSFFLCPFDRLKKL